MRLLHFECTTESRAERKASRRKTFCEDLAPRSSHNAMPSQSQPSGHSRPRSNSLFSSKKRPEPSAEGLLFSDKCNRNNRSAQSNRVMAKRPSAFFQSEVTFHVSPPSDSEAPSNESIDYSVFKNPAEPNRPSTPRSVS